MKKNSSSKNFVGKVNVSNSLLKSLVLIQKTSPDKQKNIYQVLKILENLSTIVKNLKNSNKKL